MKKLITVLLAIASTLAFGAATPPIKYSIYTTGTVAQIDAHVATAASIPVGVVTNRQTAVTLTNLTIFSAGENEDQPALTVNGPTTGWLWSPNSIISSVGDSEMLRIDSQGNATFLGDIQAGSFNGDLNGNGGGISNINGASIQVGTLNSNKLDAATAAQLALAGSGGGSGTATNLTAGTNVFGLASNYVAGVYEQTTSLIIKGSTNTIANGVYSQLYSNADGETIDAAWSGPNGCGISYWTEDGLDEYIHITNSAGADLFSSDYLRGLPIFPIPFNLCSAQTNYLDGTYGWTSNTVTEPYWIVKGWQADTGLYAPDVYANKFHGDMSGGSNLASGLSITNLKLRDSLAPRYIKVTNAGGEYTNKLKLDFTTDRFSDRLGGAEIDFQGMYGNDFQINWWPAHGGIGGTSPEMVFTSAGSFAIATGFASSDAAYRGLQIGVGSNHHWWMYLQHDYFFANNTNAGATGPFLFYPHYYSNGVERVVGSGDEYSGVNRFMGLRGEGITNSADGRIAFYNAFDTRYNNWGGNTNPQVSILLSPDTNNCGVSTLGTFRGNGSQLTNLNASELRSGTVPLERLPGTVIATVNTNWVDYPLSSGNNGGAHFSLSEMASQAGGWIPNAYALYCARFASGANGTITWSIPPSQLSAGTNVVIQAGIITSNSFDVALLARLSTMTLESPPVATYSGSSFYTNTTPAGTSCWVFQTNFTIPSTNRIGSIS